MDDFDKLLDLDFSILGSKGDKGDSIRGERGAPGRNGYSAYQVWLLNGNQGSEADYLLSIKGEKGDDGADGKDGIVIKGIDGKDGKDGKDGVGINGKDGKDGISIKGDKGDKGDNGLSAYEIWLQDNEGTEEEFIDSLKGKDAPVSQWVGNSYTELKEMEDTSIIEPSNGDLLVYNSTNLKWDDSTNNIGDYVPYTGATTNVALGAFDITANNLSGTNTGDVTLAGENYISIASQVITAAAVNLSGTNVTGSLPESSLSFTDITTNDTTTTKHGFMPKLSGSATTFFRSDGAQATPAGAVSSYIEQAYSGVTTATVTHTFGAHPIVQVLDASDVVIIPLAITHNSVNAFTVMFSVSSTGKILASVGSPQPASYVTVTTDYAVLGSDFYVECTAVDKTMTLPTAVGRAGQRFSLDNSSSGYMYVAMTGGETLQGETSVQISPGTITAVSNGTNYRVK